MKITRHKAARRTLAFYKSRYGLHEPYQVLVDATFCQASLECKIYIKDQLTTYFGGNVSLFTSPCIVEEVRKLGSEFSGAHLINKKFEWRRCRHAIGTKNARECVQDLIGKENRLRLIVATQDTTLKEALREIPGVPIVYINYNAPILEQPSPASKGHALAVTEEKTKLRDHEAGFLNSIIPEAERKEEPELKARKKKKANSLSAMKPKAERLAEEKERRRLKNQKKNLKKKARLLAQQQSEDAKEGTNTEEGESGTHTDSVERAEQATVDVMEGNARAETTDTAEDEDSAASSTASGKTAIDTREERATETSAGERDDIENTKINSMNPNFAIEQNVSERAPTTSDEVDTDHNGSVGAPVNGSKKRRPSKRRGGKNKKPKLAVNASTPAPVAASS